MRQAFQGESVVAWMDIYGDPPPEAGTRELKAPCLIRFHQIFPRAGATCRAACSQPHALCILYQMYFMYICRLNDTWLRRQGPVAATHPGPRTVEMKMFSRSGHVQQGFESLQVYMYVAVDTYAYHVDTLAYFTYP